MGAAAGTGHELVPLAAGPRPTIPVASLRAVFRPGEVSQRLTKHLRLYVDVLNVTNAPLRYYFGEPNRPIQQEYYRSWAFFGLRANF